MAKKSAGILLYRYQAAILQVLLVHPGGPFFKNKDDGAWSIPKGEYLADEDPKTAALREFEEELGAMPDPCGPMIELSPVTIKSGKTISAWALEGDLDTENIVSNTFPLEWPPKSDRIMNVPEVDRAVWFAIAEAKVKINAGQVPLIGELADLLKTRL